ncbi:ATP-dependent DNA helicase [Trichonephila clavipes]|nr:ATP-dependent DNA helicase [Trichonephila clavipes]
MDDYIGLEFQIESVDIDFAPESEILLARQHTLLWNEEQCLDIAPGQNSSPINIIYDVHGEELSFPQIYYGVPRQFDLNVRVTPYMMATSEIRCTDRRGATPDHVLYMAMKMLRIRVVEGIYNMFRCVKQTESITRKMIEDRNFMDECIDKNFVFLKSIPNSIQYWMIRKKDLFAMLRQLGKPTVFFTISANEIKWPKLLKILHGLSDSFKDIHVEDPLVNLNRSQWSHLVNEDPVTCCMYFNKLVDTIVAMLQAKMTYNPFGPYRVLDYFLCIEFQHRGSPHAHVLLRLENDPHEKISENMPKTIQLLTDLCSVSRNDLPGELYANQVHKHTFTCTKRGESSCRFGIPYWPMTETRVLLPLPKDDGRKNGLQTRATKLRKLLDEKNYETLGEFLVDNNLTMTHYLDTIRATLRRLTVVFKRDLSEIYTNTFNPWRAAVAQWLSCAAYVVEYVNKSNRGISNLHQELIKIQEQNPEKEYVEIMKQLGVKFLNTVEMSSQKAAWYLLRQPMSRSSRERYEERPSELEDKCLADFVAWYTPVTKKGRPLGTEVNDDASGDDEPAPDNVPYESTSSIGSTYRKRSATRVIRYRGYELNDVVNYKREMDVRRKRDRDHGQKRKEFESNIDIAKILDELKKICEDFDNVDPLDTSDSRDDFVRNVLGPDGTENNDDF